MDRRKRTRVNVKLQCRVNGPGAPDSQSCNITENISRNGILIRWGQDKAAPPAVGDSLVVLLQLPQNPVYGQRWMLFDANVVRVTRGGGKSYMVAVDGAPIRFSSDPSPLLEMPAANDYVN